MHLRTKKVKIPTVHNAEVEYQVFDTDVEVARVYKRETTKTGFKNGRCVGQVNTMGWFFRLTVSPNVEIGRSGGMSGGPKWVTLATALAGLETELQTQRPEGGVPNPKP